MKKNALALAAALAMTGSAFAATVATAPTVGQATAIDLNRGGVGHQLVFPYYSVQGDGVSNENVTLLTITNTDTVNGKLVKVRFRGASNSDDVFDFTLALSPADVWTAAVTKNAKGGAQLATADKSCTIPAEVRTQTNAFVTDRVKDAAAAETLEGYAEVITMADIPPTQSINGAAATANPLFTAIKHKNGVADCTQTVIDTYLADQTKYTEVLTNPTGGLTGDWILLNQKKTAAWSGSAVALRANGYGNLVFWPQRNVNLTTPIDAWTADPLLVSSSPKITPKQFDLPDLSTPYVTGDISAVFAANQRSAILATTSVLNQFTNDTKVAAVTDMLFSQPTRRYHVAYDYAGKAAVYNNASAYYSANNTTTKVKGADVSKICLADGTGNTGKVTTASVIFPQSKAGDFAGSTLFDREEFATAATVTPTTPPSFQISPNTTAPTPTASTYDNTLCGEVAVMSIGDPTGTSALGAALTRNDGTPKDIIEGWAKFGFAASAGTTYTNATTQGPAIAGLPIVGASFIRVANGSVNYGVMYQHKN